MQELDMSIIMDYLTDEITSEEKAFMKMVNWYFDTCHYHQNIYETEDMREHFLKLKEIKKIYLRGKVFVNNHTSGEKKGITTRYYNFIQNELDRGNTASAIKQAKEHLDFIEKWYSKRTYYRHLRKIRSLGIEI